MASKDLSLLGDIDDKVLECSICNGRLEDPKSLSCLHSFCLKCLKNWVRTNHGKLTCPICRKEYPIPVGGLKKLAPNTILNNLLETIKQHEEKDEAKDIALLCASHAKPLEMYCTKCKVPICIECTAMEHVAGDGKHELINIVTAFNTFKETSEDLKKAANEYINKTENVLKVVKKNAKDLEESKDASLTDIDNQIQEMVQVIQKKGEEMRKKVEANYMEEKEVNDVQITNLTKIIKELNTIVSFLNQLLMSKPATAMKSSEIVLNTMMDEINKSEEIKQKDSRQINFIKNKQPIDLLKENDIGNVVFKPLTIKVEGIPRGVGKCDDDCVLVSFWTNAIHKYKQSGECISKITLQKDVKVTRMYKMKNGNIVFSDRSIDCIQVCDMNGHVIKSIGKGVLKNPRGIHIDEATNVIYVADGENGCVLRFNINSGKKLKKIGTPNEEHVYSDVALTKTGKVLVADADNHQVLLYDDKDKSLKVLINEGDEDGEVIMPDGVVVDEDDNIIIASVNKLQLFTSDGQFIRRLDKQEDGISVPQQLCIISHNPCIVAVTNWGNNTIQILNY
ncbi:tripartite motif-containing protein 2-like [Antedon mediterranea]|uniref:tripartite motif-containing protein 2-like n=1 Tax=Antedon mediterranea TaxID=105859 RepID=UPI003AF410A8